MMRILHRIILVVAGLLLLLQAAIAFRAAITEPVWIPGWGVTYETNTFSGKMVRKCAFTAIPCFCGLYLIIMAIKRNNMSLDSKNDMCK